MRIWKRLTVFLLLLALLAGLAAVHADEAGETADSAFDMEITIGYDGRMTYGKYMPVRVRIRNLGGDFEGTLGLNANVTTRDYDRYETRIALPAGAEREYVLTPAVYTRQDVFTAEITRDGKVLCSASVKPDSLINPSAMMVGVLSTRPQNMNNLTINRENDTLGRYEFWETVPLTAETFPEDAALLKSFGILVLDDIDPAGLSRKQQDALDTWLKAGRILICGGGASAARNVAYFSGITGLSADGMDNSEDVAGALAAFAGRTGSSRKVPAAIALITGGEPIASDEAGHGLIYRSDAGAGRIYTLAFESGDQQLNGESMMHTFWQQTFAEQESSLYSSIQYYSPSNDNQVYVVAGSVTPVRSRSNMLPALLILCAVPVLACVFWLVLKKMDKRQWMWLILPLLSAGAAAAVILLSGSADTNRPMAVISRSMVQESGGTLHCYNGITAAAPESGIHTYSMGGERLSVQYYDYFDYYDDEESKPPEPDRLRTCYTAGGENVTSAVSVSPWSQISLMCEETAEAQGRVETAVWMEEDALCGEIINGTDMRLNAGYVITTYGFVSVPALEPGGKTTFRMVKGTYSNPQNQVCADGEMYMESSPGISTAAYSAYLPGYLTTYTTNNTAESEKASAICSMIDNAAMRVRQGKGGYSYYESAAFLYCAEPDGAPVPDLVVDGEAVTRKTSITLLIAEMEYTPVGRTGILFRAPGMDVPVRVATDTKLLPIEEADQATWKNTNYHMLSENPTFRFTFAGLEGVKAEKLTVNLESYYLDMAKVYALNASSGLWEEIRAGKTIENPERYLDSQGRLYLQFRPDNADQYSEIPTPLVTLEGRVKNAED